MRLPVLRPAPSGNEAFLKWRGLRKLLAERGQRPRVGDRPDPALPGGTDSFVQNSWRGHRLTFRDVGVNVLQGWPVAAFGFL